MRCPHCGGVTRKYGRNKRGGQRFRCATCKRVSSEHPKRLFGRMHIPEEKGLLALALLADGGSVRSIERCVGLHRDSVLRLQEYAGRQLFRFMDREIRNVPAKSLQFDELWTYVSKRDKRLKREERLNEDIGSQFVFLALDPASKLIVGYEVGKRDFDRAWAFLMELRPRIAGNPAISTDGFQPYIPAVARAFPRSEYGQVVKTFTARQAPRLEAYTPARRVTCELHPIQGDPETICTSHVERANATFRCHVRRLSRLTLCFSKKLENLVYSLAVAIAVYNFSRSHRSLSMMTPAMAAGIAKRPLTIADMLAAVA